MCLDLLDEKDGPIISAGNTQGELFVWDVTENQKVANYWNSN